MALVKKISVNGPATGSTVYVIIRRESDGSLLNDATGGFSAAPADPYLLLAENATIAGLFEVSESRTTWTDGEYRVFPYIQVGGAPSPAADTQWPPYLPLFIRTDALVNAGSVYDNQVTANTNIQAILAFVVNVKTVFSKTLGLLEEITKKLTSILSQILDLEKRFKRMEMTKK